MPRVKIYVTNYCHFCRKAKSLLTKKKIPFEAFDVTDDDEKRSWLVETTGYRTVPQIFIDEKPIGGFDQLVELDKEGKLEALTS